jgi:hypothetical protein
MHDEIRVNAVLDRPGSAWFDGLDVSSDEHGQTTIAGPVVDPGLELSAVGCTDPC